MQLPTVRRLKFVLLFSSVASLVMLVIAAYKENLTAEWLTYQHSYARILSQRTEGAPASEYPIEIRQAYLEEWNRVDRCVTCHVGMDDPDMAHQAQPLTAHPGDILEHHPADQFGCTICHQGQGRATAADAAHGHVPFWDEPLLTGDFVQATCTRCHGDTDDIQAPVLNRGRRLLSELGCAGCHKTGDIVEQEKPGPPLDSIGSKVTRNWLRDWLTNPRDFLPQAKMPHYELTPGAVDGLSAYLMTFRNPAIDDMPDPEGDFDAGETIYRQAQCIVCHVTKLDYADNPIGGDIGPSLLKVGNKINQRWLVAFLEDPHSFLPHTKMPGYRFSAQEAENLAQFAIEEWVDYDLLDAQEAEPEPPPATPEEVHEGALLYTELGCAGCHELNGVVTKPDATDLTFIGSTPVHQLSFGDAHVRRTVPDFLYTKLTSPQLLHERFQLPPGEEPAAAIWQNLSPASLYSAVASLPDGTESERLAWILEQAQRTGALDGTLKLPEGSADAQADWLVAALNDSKALSSLKMPTFELSREDAEALTIALMSLRDVTAPSRRFEVPPRQRAVFNPQDEFGKLERQYRCLSCHKIRDSGDLLAADLTYEGNRVDREWLDHYMQNPYSMRRMMTIAMPNFHFSEEESRLMADYMSYVFVDSGLGDNWTRSRDEADADRGQLLFNSRGCIACHQLHGTGGDVGPSLTTQVPEFPQGTWVGDKLKGEWIYAWLKDPQALLPDTIEPNLRLTDQEALDLTAFLLSLKNPEFQEAQ